MKFEITEQTRQRAAAWFSTRGLKHADYLFPGRLNASPRVPTRQYGRIAHRWVALIEPDGTAYGTHTMRKANRWWTIDTKNLRLSNCYQAIQKSKAPSDTL